MRKFIIAAFCAFFMVGVLAVPASAAGKHKVKRLSVLVQPAFLPECTVGADRVRAGFAFRAIVKRKNVKAPSRININYKITDANTGAVIVAETVRLTPRNGYINVGDFGGYTVGTPLNFDASFNYRSTLSRKSIVAKTALNLMVPTLAELQADGTETCV